MKKILLHDAELSIWNKNQLYSIPNRQIHTVPVHFKLLENYETNKFKII